MARKFRLEIELVPCPLWHINLRRFIGRARWRYLRKAVGNAAGYACEICGEDAPLESKTGGNAHEEWIYRRRSWPTTTLVRIGWICRWCHAVHHIGVTRNLVLGGEADPNTVDAAIKHFCKVNGCERRDFDDHEVNAREVFNERSSLTWAVDWGRFVVLLGSLSTADKYELAADGGPAPPKRGSDMPWLRADGLTIGGPSGAVHALPLFDTTHCARVTRTTPIMGFLPLERNWRTGEAKIVKAWVGKQYQEYRWHRLDAENANWMSDVRAAIRSQTSSQAK